MNTVFCKRYPISKRWVQKSKPVNQAVPDNLGIKTALNEKHVSGGVKAVQEQGLSSGGGHIVADPGNMGFKTVLNGKHVPGAVNSVQVQSLSPGGDHIDSVHAVQVLEQVSGVSVVERIHSGMSGNILVQKSMRPNNLDSVHVEHVLDQFSGVSPREINAQVEGNMCNSNLVHAVHVQSQGQGSWNTARSS
ncbi:uncharacterized protein A4U43_C02F18990 [Asparagus officinalis]|uniref:Uncharacterized protein n=1 Tax=Asparagus officinalis TaxID=4686 RepID=A0A5P1FJJ3_ASPOF|nr:uncharacterized protein A4U43_C02F18990 [Asparagus officinalis]